MKKYTLIFCATYFVLAIVVAVVAEWLKLKGGAGLGIVATLAASSFSAWKFTKDHNRQPTLEEKKAYAWQALAGVWVVSLILVLAVFFAIFSPSDTKALLSIMATKFFLIVATCGALFISLLYYIAIRWSFAWYAKMACKSSNAA